MYYMPTFAKASKAERCEANCTGHRAQGSGHRAQSKSVLSLCFKPDSFSLFKIGFLLFQLLQFFKIFKYQSYFLIHPNLRSQIAISRIIYS